MNISPGIIHLCAGDDMGAGFHQLGDGLAVARAFEDEIGDQRDRFRVVELDAALEASPRHHGGGGDQELVLFPRGQKHVGASTLVS
jgi:hypothetical protein